MDTVLFEQIRDKVKEVWVARMIDDRLIELHTVENKKKMAATIIDIRRRARTSYIYKPGGDYIWDSLSWIKGTTIFNWFDSPGHCLQLTSYNFKTARGSKTWWTTPEEIKKHKINSACNLLDK